MNAKDFDAISTRIEDGINMLDAIRASGFALRLDGSDLLVYATGGHRRLPNPLASVIERDLPGVRLAFVAALEAAKAISRAKPNSRRAPRRQKHKSEMQR